MRKQYNEFILHEDYAVMVCQRKGEIVHVILDLDDVERVSSDIYGKWVVRPGNGNRLYIYSVLTQKSDRQYKQVALHREILGVKSEEVIVDHISGDTLDNRKANLVPSDPQLNARNLNNKIRSTNIAKCPGVNFDNKRGKWRARITVEKGKDKHLGYFDDMEDAIQARKKAEKEYWR